MEDDTAIGTRDLRIDRQNLRVMLGRVLSHYMLNPRWPCPECDRPGVDSPLRVNRIVTEDGNEYRLGCSRCNADVLLDDVTKFLHVPVVFNG